MDNQITFWRDLMNNIHCCAYHLYHLPLRIDKKEFEINNIDFEYAKIRDTTVEYSKNNKHHKITKQ